MGINWKRIISSKLFRKHHLRCLNTARNWCQTYNYSFIILRWRISRHDFRWPRRYICNSHNRLPQSWSTNPSHCCHIFPCLSEVFVSSHSVFCFYRCRESWAFVCITNVQSKMCVNNWVHYGLKVVFDCLHIILYSIMMMMKFSDLSQWDRSNWVRWQVKDPCLWPGWDGCLTWEK